MWPQKHSQGLHVPWFSFFIIPLSMTVCQISCSKKRICLKQTNLMVKREILNQKNTTQLYRWAKNYKDFSVVPPMQYCCECICLLKAWVAYYNKTKFSHHVNHYGLWLLHENYNWESLTQSKSNLIICSHFNLEIEVLV